MKYGSSSRLMFKVKYPYDLSNSLDQSLKFYMDHFYAEDYVVGINTEKTFLMNPESRDYLNDLEACYLKRKSMVKNRLKYSKEYLDFPGLGTFDMINLENYHRELFGMMYQLGRALKYVLDKGYYMNSLSPSDIKLGNQRGFKYYKFIKTLDFRYTSFRSE
jgi:hypothetical protein